MTVFWCIVVRGKMPRLRMGIGVIAVRGKMLRLRLGIGVIVVRGKDAPFTDGYLMGVHRA